MPIITLTTDFGLSDYYVALLKGSLYSISHDINICDITHTIAPQDVSSAAFFLRNVKDSFPRGTIHLIAVHYLYEPNNLPRLLMVKHKEQYVVAPDNGVLSLIFADEKFDCYVAEPNTTMYSSYAGAVAMILSQRWDRVLDKALDITTKTEIKPIVKGSVIRGTIIHIDSFGNLITNITREIFVRNAMGRSYKIFFSNTDPIEHIIEHYGMSFADKVCAIFNESDYLELGLNLGSANRKYRLNINDIIQIVFDDTTNSKI